MALNTRIRGEQLLYDDVTIGVDSFKIEVKDGGIDTLQLAADAVDGSKIEDAAVDSEHIVTGSVDNAHLAGSIAYSKLVLTGEILNADLAGSIALTKLVAGSAGQIIVGAVTTGIPTYVSMTGDVTITDAGVTIIGNTKVTDAMINDDVATGLAGVGLSAASGILAVDLNELAAEATFDVAADYIGIVDATDDGSNKTLWSVIATAIAGTGLTATAGVLSADAIADHITESDILKEDESANCNGVTVVFSLASTPVNNSVQVFLNGMLQQEGSGKDYTLTGTTVTFATAPETGDILLIHYTINN